jgi:2-polyprenyl-6-hydroxyphenyl methylase/3-demethylubiquinone-9 3-methyltransferase
MRQPSFHVDHRHEPQPWQRRLIHLCPTCKAQIYLEHPKEQCCRSCGTIIRNELGVYRFLDDGSTVNEWQKIYDELAEGRIEDTPSGLLFREPFAWRLHTFKRLFGGLKDDNIRILDVGCANGMFGEALVGPRGSVGVEFSFQMCVQASARGMIIYHADALNLPFGDAQFDVVYCAGLLEHISDLDRLMQELWRVCCPGGRVLIGTANSESAARKVMRVIRQFKQASLKIMRKRVLARRASDIKEAVQKAGLLPEMVLWTHFPLWVAYRLDSLDNPLRFLASNFYVRLRKPAR